MHQKVASVFVYLPVRGCVEVGCVLRGGEEEGGSKREIRRQVARGGGGGETPGGMRDRRRESEREIESYLIPKLTPPSTQ